MFCRFFNDYHCALGGFALLLALDAMLLWGGSFPFLPAEMQSWELLSNFYLLQSLAFGGTFLISMFTAYFLPWVTRRALVLVSAAPVSLGSLCLVATLYLPDEAMLLVCISALLLGAGCASLLILWQRFFASLPAERGNRCLIIGTGLAALIYLILELALQLAQHFIPIAFSALLVPLVFVPLGGLSLALAARSVDLAQPMFEDTPCHNKRVYLNTVKTYATSALCVGCLGLASGIARALVLTDPSLGALVNIVAMLGALISSIALLVLWRQASFRFDVLSAFQVVFPFITTGFLLLPFFGLEFLYLFSGALYMAFVFSVMIMMIQCSQASRDFGINPQFIYGFFAAVVYVLQSFGFVLGTWSRGLEIRETVQSQHVLLIALAAVWVLALALFAARGKANDAYAQLHASPSEIEFLQEAGPAVADASPAVDVSAVADVSPAEDEERKTSDRRQGDLSRQCTLLRQHYLLSLREIEVVELVACGNSVASIADRLVVTENTVRTHMKRIYSKLAIHKRQELLDLLETLEQSATQHSR
ncbi:MAG: LuxR C-terminal-related transcriptional regulator [Coriobacteriales bacterium]|nr:LuxR C-terminal-related transcriptional regulator [Coriobacteriales bacterium]